MAFLIPAAIAAASIGGAAISAVGAIQQGQAQAGAANYNASVQRNNALTATRVAAQQEEEQRRRANLQLGEQSAAIGQAGIGYGGSAADIQRQSYINAALDQLNTRYAGQLQSQSYAQQADLLNYEGSQARTAGYLGAGSAILSGASNAYGNYRLMKGP